MRLNTWGILGFLYCVVLICASIPYAEHSRDYALPLRVALLVLPPFVAGIMAGRRMR